MTMSPCRSAVKGARAAGFDNISIDLIFGIPGMSLRDWDRNVMKALQLGIDHLSAYHLTIEPGTPFAALAAEGKLKPVDEALSEAQFMLARRILTGMGFDHYEISNYARTPEKRSRHNYSYWNGDKYLGLGPSAHSYNGRRREFAAPSVEQYLAGAGTGSIYSGETLSKTDKYNEYVMLALRTYDGIRRDTLARKFGPDMLLCFEYAAEELIRSGRLIHTRDEYRIPVDKLMISDDIIRSLFVIDDE